MTLFNTRNTRKLPQWCEYVSVLKVATSCSVRLPNFACIVLCHLTPITFPSGICVEILFAFHPLFFIAGFKHSWAIQAILNCISTPGSLLSKTSLNNDKYIYLIPELRY